MIYCYGRVSTQQQNLDRQLVEFEKYKPYKLITDKESGKNFDRPNYQKMRKQLKEDDTLIVLSLDRFGRNYDQIKSEWQYLTNKGVKIKVIDMPIIDTTKEDLTSKLISDIVLQLLSYVAQSEYEKIHERQAQGIKLAKEKGVKFGRPRAVVPDNFEEVLKQYANDKKTTLEQACKKVGMSRMTFLRTAYNFGFKEKFQKIDYKTIAEKINNNQITFDEAFEKSYIKNKFHFAKTLRENGCNIKTQSEILNEKIDFALEKIKNNEFDIEQAVNYCGCVRSTFIKKAKLRGFNIINHKEELRKEKVNFRKKIIVILCEGKTFQFNTITECAKKMNYSKDTIRKQLRGENTCIARAGIIIKYSE